MSSALSTKILSNLKLDVISDGLIYIQNTDGSIQPLLKKNDEGRYFFNAADFTPDGSFISKPKIQIVADSHGAEIDPSRIVENKQYHFKNDDTYYIRTEFDKTVSSFAITLKNENDNEETYTFDETDSSDNLVFFTSIVKNITGNKKLVISLEYTDQEQKIQNVSYAEPFIVIDNEKPIITTKVPNRDDITIYALKGSDYIEHGQISDNSINSLYSFENIDFDSENLIGTATIDVSLNNTKYENIGEDTVDLKYMNTVGKFNMRYNYTDPAGNEAQMRYRTVNVFEMIAPTIVSADSFSVDKDTEYEFEIEIQHEHEIYGTDQREKLVESYNIVLPNGITIEADGTIIDDKLTFPTKNLPVGEYTNAHISAVYKLQSENEVLDDNSDYTNSVPIFGTNSENNTMNSNNFTIVVSQNSTKKLQITSTVENIDGVEYVKNELFVVFSITNDENFMSSVITNYTFTDNGSVDPPFYYNENNSTQSTSLVYEGISEYLMQINSIKPSWDVDPNSSYFDIDFNKIPWNTDQTNRYIQWGPRNHDVVIPPNKTKRIAVLINKRTLQGSFQITHNTSLTPTTHFQYNITIVDGVMSVN